MDFGPQPANTTVIVQHPPRNHRSIHKTEILANTLHAGEVQLIKQPPNGTRKCNVSRHPPNLTATTLPYFVCIQQHTSRARDWRTRVDQGTHGAIQHQNSICSNCSKFFYRHLFQIYSLPDSKVHFYRIFNP